jgi:hypothetical protein
MVPAGALCAVHTDQRAVDTCARCGNYVCIGCYESDESGSYCAPCYAKVGTRGQQSSRATTALVLALVALLGSCFPLGIPAVILGHMELSAIANGEAPVAGRNLALGAVWIGWISIALSILVVVGVIVLVGLLD